MLLPTAATPPKAAATSPSFLTCWRLFDSMGSMTLPSPADSKDPLLLILPGSLHDPCDYSHIRRRCMPAMRNGPDWGQTFGAFFWVERGEHEWVRRGGSTRKRQRKKKRVELSTFCEILEVILSRTKFIVCKHPPFRNRRHWVHYSTLGVLATFGD